MAADGHALPDQLSDEETIDLVRQMGDAGVPVIFLSGGEPMMRPNFWEILERAHAQGIRVNLHQLHAHRPRRRQAAGQRRRWIATSMYGPAEFHDAMVRVPGTHAQVVEAVKVLRAEGVGSR